ncbi:D-alanyl-D-alanine carboxypeptidase family protein [Lichenicoccus sp.]|uniref:D-alanyl-D-alanine carboxypeptidase family protein n=1 Tax=Lichenicoccus sp. TaxID=2781899 RepID=UPI003D09DCDB
MLTGGAAILATLIPLQRAAARRHPHAKPQAADASEEGEGDGTVVATPADTPIGPLDTEARWAFILDADTGSVLLQKAADEPMPPSSLTKMMTAYLVFQALAEQHLKLDQTLPVSERAWRMQGSKMFVPLGGQISVEDLIRGMLIQSGNDACIVLAEGIAGSEDQFVVLMNQQAKRMGLTKTQFRNATGWPDPDHHMSARDIATLARHVIQDYPQYYHYFSEKDYKFNNIAQGNRNVLVDKGLADGLKTGHTDAGGFGLCASSERDGRRIIMVLNGLPSSRARAEEGARLLGWAFINFEDVKLFTRYETIQSVPVWLGRQPVVPAVTRDDVVLTLPHGWRSHVKIRVDYASPLPAPVAAGAQVAILTLSGAGPTDLTYPLFASVAVPRLSLPNRAIAVIEHSIGGG